MNTETETIRPESLIKQLNQRFATRAELYDREGSFVAQNYQDLKEHSAFGAMIPQDLGGLGLTFAQMCQVLRELAKGCGSTALSLSMHSHLVAANLWKLKQGKPVEEGLKKIAQAQTILISTGAKDWLSSNGTMTKTAGGYLLNGVKHFASQSAIGDVLVTSARYESEADIRVLHFPLPMSSDGITVLNNWDTLGMRGTGSHSVKLEQVFVPEESVVLNRPADEYHPVYNVVLTVAMPLIMSVYMGMAQRAFETAKEFVQRIKQPKPHSVATLAEISNQLTQAELNWQSMIRIANEFDFEATNENGHQVLSRKTNMSNALIACVTLAMELVGGSAYFKSNPLERIFRDMQAVKYHPLPEAEQLMFSGKHLLGISHL